MSYCRFSTNDFNCDLYIYYTGPDDHEYWQVHIAANRIVGPVPPIIWPDDDSPAAALAMAESYTAQMNYLHSADRIAIDHPLAGQDIECDNLLELKITLDLLKAQGFIFPDDVLTQVQAEIDDEL